MVKTTLNFSKYSFKKYVCGKEFKKAMHSCERKAFYFITNQCDMLLHYMSVFHAPMGCVCPYIFFFFIV